MQTRAILIEDIPCMVNKDEFIRKFTPCGKILAVEEFLPYPKSLIYHLGVVFSTTTAVRLALSMHGKYVQSYAIKLIAVPDYNKWCGYAYNSNRIFTVPRD